MERLACMKRHPRRGCNSGMGRKPGTRARAARPAAATRSRVDKIPFPCVCLVKLHECFREILPGPIQGGGAPGKRPGRHAGRLRFPIVRSSGPKVKGVRFLPPTAFLQ